MIVDPLVLAAFIPAALALNLTPGADMMLCAGQGLKSGPGAGWRASAGVATGGLIHGLVAGLGIAALVASHPVALIAVRWIGAAYLLWMAWNAWHAPGPRKTTPRSGPAFRDGLIVNITNPKVILFTLAFVPQFVDPTRPVLPQFMVFATILSVGGLVANGLAGTLAGAASRRLASGRAARIAGRIPALLFTGLALRLAFLERN